MPQADFRSQLDTLLRSKNPKAVRQFLVAEGQWPDDAAIDVERAMWLMIAGSPALQELHNEAQEWLNSHGYQAEAEMLRERDRASQKSPVARYDTNTRARSGASPGRPGAASQRPTSSSAAQPPSKSAPDRSPQPRARPPKQA